jgi:Arc/MetJ-type ribon-helix-helix transcriptional regulator
MRTISLKLPDALLRQLERAAKEEGHSKSDVIRSALQQYLNGARPRTRGSFLEAAGDLIGCVEGPGDLSHNPEHMEGFGR